VAAFKCALAMTALPPLGIPTPPVLGWSEDGGQAALLCDTVVAVRWDAEARIAAARILARLRGLSESSLSAELRHLARISDPRASRTTGGLAPQPAEKTLAHGDYFSANILLTSDGLRIIDWETFGWGDPMWDLGFLVGADRGLSEDEVEATVATYAERAPVDRERLAWHRRRWREYWGRR